MKQLSMLTTVDNPHDPFNQFDTWYQFDEAHGYHTSGLLARIVNNSKDLSDPDHDAAIEAAIDEIVKENVSGMHRKITREVED